MEVRYNADTDTAYLRFLEPEESVEVYESEEVSPGVVVDYTKDGVAVGVEIYDDARRKLDGAPGRESEDELALKIGRAWIAGYRAGMTDRDTESRRTQSAR